MSSTHSNPIKRLLICIGGACIFNDQSVIQEIERKVQADINATQTIYIRYHYRTVSGITEVSFSSMLAHILFTGRDCFYGYYGSCIILGKHIIYPIYPRIAK